MNKIKLTAVMFLWGSIGLFSRYIDLSPVLLAFYRAVLSIPVLLVMVKLNVKSEQIEKTSVLLYALSGILLNDTLQPDQTTHCILQTYENNDTVISELQSNNRAATQCSSLV